MSARKPEEQLPNSWSEFRSFLERLIHQWKINDAQAVEELSPEDAQAFGGSRRSQNLNEFLIRLHTWSLDQPRQIDQPTWSTVARMLETALGESATLGEE